MLLLRLVVLLSACSVLWGLAIRTFSGGFFIALWQAIAYAAITVTLTVGLGVTVWQLAVRHLGSTS
jgi:hypothetical protein